MAFMLYSIDEAIDCKYIVEKTMKGQAKIGTLIHVMDARETSDGVTVYYRVTRTKQDYMIKFDTIKQFCKWCMPSTFLAKYYDRLSYSEVVKYIKVENRSFLTFQLPVILFALIVVWAAVTAVVMLHLIDLDMMLILIAGGALSVLIVAAVIIYSRISRTQMVERLYKKVAKTAQ